MCFEILFNCLHTNNFQDSVFSGSANRADAWSCNTFHAALICLSSVNGAPTAKRRINCPDRTCLKWLESTCSSWSLQVLQGGKSSLIKLQRIKLYNLKHSNLLYVIWRFFHLNLQYPLSYSLICSHHLYHQDEAEDENRQVKMYEAQQPA